MITWLDLEVEEGKADRLAKRSREGEGLRPEVWVGGLGGGAKSSSKGAGGGRSHLGSRLSELQSLVMGLLEVTTRSRVLPWKWVT